MIRPHLMALALATLAIPAPAMAGPQLGVIVQWAQRQAVPRVSVGYNEGYARGLRSGEDDARRGNRFEFVDESDYRNADHGYRREYGAREFYRDEYRRGFAVGYEAGYRRVRPGGRFEGGGRWGYPGNPGGGYGRGRYDVAAQQGYNDGYEAGFDDGRDGRRYDPIGESRYRSGDRGYNSRYGPRETYKANYRDAFRDGYEEGYDEARRFGRY